jgi:propane monooxygenase reductase component
MADDKHVVRFEPVGIEIEVGEEQTVLRAAAEQGLMLMHGCKEGQCAACKSFVLDGEDIELDKYSTFALPDFERDEGFTLLCRAHVYEDVTIELLNYDEDMIKSGLPLQRATAEVESIIEVTHDLRHVTLKLLEPSTLRYFPGQYVDVTVPGHGITRSFSMANTPAAANGRLEFVIKVYPDGRFSSLLAGGALAVGDAVEVVGPYGVFTLREGSDARIVLVGGGAGMAPILALLRALAELGSDRDIVFYYGARTARDLCFEDELRELERTLPRFRYVPALSEPDGDEWAGETGLITEVLKRREDSLTGAHAYVCGPPPMVEAAMPALAALGVEDRRIYYDKFTTTGNAEK